MDLDVKITNFSTTYINKWHNFSVEMISVLDFIAYKSYLRFVIELTFVAFCYVDTTSEWNKWTILYVSPTVMPQ